MEREQIKTRTKDEETDETLDWLLGFERQANAPVVVSLLIEDGEVHFQMCGLKSRFLDDGDTDGPDEDEIMNIRTPEIKGLSSKNYIW
jgi:hypothetical protein